MSRLTLSALISHARTPLYRNGYALLLSSAMTSALGVIYWMLAARFYDARDVGVNAALLSAMVLVSGTSQLGLPSAIVRFVPVMGLRARKLIIGAYITSLLAAAVGASIFALGVDIWFPTLHAFGSEPLYTTWFVLATMSWCLFQMQDSVIVGLRESLWIPLENATFAVVKIVLLLLMVDTFANYGIFASWSVALALSLIPVNLLIFLHLLPRFARSVNPDTVYRITGKQVARYAGANYVSTFLSLASTALLPILVTHIVGPRANAYFYQPWLILGSLQLVATNMTMSFTVEAARNPANLGRYIQRALVAILRLLVPTVLLVVVGAPYLLRIFGTDYEAEGTALLRLLALGSVPNVAVVLYIGLARAQQRIGGLIAVQTALSVLLLGLSYILLPEYGIRGVGIAWLTAQTMLASVLAVMQIAPVMRGVAQAPARVK